MATVKFEAVATIRWTQDGEEKKRYHKMGVVFEGDKGMNIKIDSIPVGWDGWIGLYVPKPKEEKPDAKPVTNGFDDMKDDVPFNQPYSAGLWRIA